MKLRLIIALLLITAGIGSVSAQKTEAKQINMIKLDGRYLYGEATMPTEAEAKEAADITLINYINDKLKEHHIDRRLGLDGLEQTQYITVKRGANIRVFAYVECSVYGIPSAASQAAAVTETSAPVQPQPKPQPQPVAQAPAAPVEAPRQQPQPKPQPQPQPVAQAPAAPVETPRQPAPSAPQPAPKQQVPDRSIASGSGLSAWQAEAIEDLLRTPNLNSAAQLLNEFRGARKVLAFGSPKECPDASKCFWVVFDNNLNTITVLSNGDNDVRHNFKTGSSDGLGNYSGSTAVWFMLSK